MPERRNDIGSKVIAGSIIVVLSLFFSHTMSVGSAGLQKACVNETKIGRLEERTNAMLLLQNEIRDDIKKLLNRSK